MLFFLIFLFSQDFSVHLFAFGVFFEINCATVAYFAKYLLLAKVFFFFLKIVFFLFTVFIFILIDPFFFQWNCVTIYR